MFLTKTMLIRRFLGSSGESVKRGTLSANPTTLQIRPGSMSACSSSRLADEALATDSSQFDICSLRVGEESVCPSTAISLGKFLRMDATAANHLPAQVRELSASGGKDGVLL